jgi:hypothetical protein
MARIVQFQRTIVETAELVVPADVDPETWQSAHSDEVAEAFAESPAEVTFDVLDEWEDDDLDAPDGAEGEDA